MCNFTGSESAGLLFLSAPPVCTPGSISHQHQWRAGFCGQRSSFADFVIGKKKKAAKQLYKPYGFTIKNGVIYVCDTRVNRIAVLDLLGKKFDFIEGSTTLKLKKPVNIAVDDDGTKYIADSVLSTVVVLDSNNRFVTTLGNKDTLKPTDVALAGNNVLVVDVRTVRWLYLISKAIGKLRCVFVVSAGKNV